MSKVTRLPSLIGCAIAATVVLAGCDERTPPAAQATTRWEAKRWDVREAAGGRVQLAVNADRSIVATWLASEGGWSKGTGPAPRTEIATLDPRSATAITTATDGVVTTPLIPANGRAAAQVATFTPTEYRSGKGLAVRDASRRAGEPGGIDLAANSIEIGNSALATNANGSAIVAWFQATGKDSKAALVYATRSTSGQWSSPVVLQRGIASFSTYVPTLSVATDRRGRGLIVSRDLGRRQEGIVAFRIRAGQAEAPATISSTARPDVIRAAVLDSGACAIAWSEQTVGLEAHDPRTISVATLPPTGKRALRPVILDRAEVRTSPGPGFELAASPLGGATLAWTKRTRRGRVAAIAHANADARFRGTPQQIDGIDEIGGLAIRADGTELLTVGNAPPSDQPRSAAAWVREPKNASYRPLGSIPIPPEAIVAPLDTSGSIDQGTTAQIELSQAIPAPAFDPTTGDALVAFAIAPQRRNDAAHVHLLRRSVAARPR